MLPRRPRAPHRAERIVQVPSTWRSRRRWRETASCARRHLQSDRGRSLSWKLGLSNFGRDGEARIDNVRDLVLERLSHERRGPAFREPMIGDEPALHFAGGML